MSTSFQMGKRAIAIFIYSYGHTRYILIWRSLISSSTISELNQMEERSSIQSVSEEYP